MAGQVSSHEKVMATLRGLSFLFGAVAICDPASLLTAGSPLIGVAASEGARQTIKSAHEGPKASQGGM